MVDRTVKHMGVGSHMEVPTEAEPKLVFVSGCFDMLHVGHTRLLAHARSRGDKLVVGLNSDESVARLKGEGRPWNLQEDRREMLMALTSVDSVVVFNHDTPAEAIRALAPRLVLVGSEYEGKVPTEVVEAIHDTGAHLELFPMSALHSTTKLLERARAGGGQ